MSDYANYTFSLGDTPKRHYKGQRLRPKDGFSLGLKVSKELCTVLASSGSSIESLGGNKDSDNKDSDNKDSDNKNIGVIVNALSKINPDVFLGFVDMVLSSTIIEASSDGGDNANLVSERAINDWFGRYPEDYLMFTGYVLWENVSPFLPKPFQEVVKNLEVDLKKTL